MFLKIVHTLSYRLTETAGIPFEHALELINTMNEGYSGPLVEILNDERDAISVWLTVAGEIAVQNFKNLYEELRLSVAEELRLRKSA